MCFAPRTPPSVQQRRGTTHETACTCMASFRVPTPNTHQTTRQADKPYDAVPPVKGGAAPLPLSNPPLLHLQQTLVQRPYRADSHTLTAANITMHPGCRRAGAWSSRLLATPPSSPACAPRATRPARCPQELHVVPAASGLAANTFIKRRRRLNSPSATRSQGAVYTMAPPRGLTASGTLAASQVQISARSSDLLDQLGQGGAHLGRVELAHVHGGEDREHACVWKRWQRWWWWWFYVVDRGREAWGRSGMTGAGRQAGTCKGAT